MKYSFIILSLTFFSLSSLQAQTKLDDPKSQVRKKIVNPEAVKEKDAEEEIAAKQQQNLQALQKPKSLSQRAKSYIKEKAQIPIPFTDKKISLN
jgi:predicted transcriptional regulator